MLWYLAFRMATFLVRHVPRRWGLAITRRLGWVIYRISPLAEAGRDNFRHVLGPDAAPALVSQVTRQAFQTRLLNYYDMLWLSDKSLEEVGWRTDFEGLEEIDSLARQKRGAVIGSGHVGPMEFTLQGVASMGYNIFGIFEHLDNERLLSYMTQLRSAHGFEGISAKGPLLDLYRRTKRGGFLATAVDRDSTNTGRIVQFFGAPAWMPDGYARLAVRADVPLVFGYCRYTQRGAGVKLHPPIYPDRSLSKEEAVGDMVQQTLRLLEKAIQENPGAWHLSSPVWQLAQERLKGEASA
jgi:lauroyl/myristoyl acyltransferase